MARVTSAQPPFCCNPSAIVTHFAAQLTDLQQRFFFFFLIFLSLLLPLTGSVRIYEAIGRPALSLFNPCPGAAESFYVYTWAPRPSDRKQGNSFANLTDYSRWISFGIFLLWLNSDSPGRTCGTLRGTLCQAQNRPVLPLLPSCPMAYCPTSGS